MKVIGLCGGSGSGKGTVCELFSELGIPSINTDAVYHNMTTQDSECLRSLRQEFGDTVIGDDGKLDRKALRTLVFSNEKKLKRLNEISHKYILDKTRAYIASYKEKGMSAVIVDAPLLFESGFDKECDFTVCVISDRDLRISRIINRDGLSIDDANRRIDSQISDKELISLCDFVIENNGDFDMLKTSVRETVRKIQNNIER